MSESVVFAREDALNRVDNDIELLRELVQLFLGEFSQNVSSLRRLAEENNGHSFSRVAHSIKGASSNIGAMVVASLAARLEHTPLGAGIESMIQSLEGAVAEFEVVYGASNQKNFSV